MAIKVRTCKSLAEFQQAIGAIAEYGGWEINDEIAKRFLRVFPLERMHAAFEGRRAVGGAGAFPFDLSVPGGSVPCAGVTVVGVYPTHRRQGILTSMMRAQLDDVHERGEPIAALWASDERIYGRYGYGLASLAGEIELPRTHAQFAAPSEERGTVRYVESKDVPKVLGPVWKHVFRERPGMFARSAEWWKSRLAEDPPQWRRGAGPRRFAVIELGGSVEGYAIYRHDPKWEGGVPDAGKVAVQEVLARSLEAETALWRYLLDIEWAGAVSARLLPLDTPLWWILARAAADEDARGRRPLGAAGRRGRRAVGALVLRARADHLPGAGRLLLVERRPLEARGRCGEEDAIGRRPRLRRRGARLGLSRRLHLRGARARRSRRGAEGRGGGAGRCDVPYRRAAVVP